MSNPEIFVGYGGYDKFVNFRGQLEAFAKKVTLSTTRAYTRIVELMAWQIIEGTPVDTGLARGNWQTGVNAAKAGPIDRLDPMGGAASEEVSMEMNGVKLGDQVWFTNDLRYIASLEYGHSKQAPYGMVRLAVLKFQFVVDQAVGYAEKYE